tara:strand:- start:3933 stop:5765 length:1833 start_codon:yes stop_codon:yes gene_type:complete
MNKLINYRGPDNNGLFLSNKFMFGHNRLTIVDNSVTANQPFTSTTSRSIIIFNGEIYNFKFLRKKALSAGYKFKTFSDTEVIVAVYEIWGIDGLDILEGMYVFSIYDRIKNILIIRRDKFGIKPFYYRFLNDKFYGSSELLPLLKINNEETINSKALGSIFLFDNNCFEESLVNGIKKLSPGNQIIIDSYQFNISKWFNLNSLESDFYKGDIDIYSDLKLNIEESVRKQADTNVPTCIFYSGGIDSSIITYYSLKINKNIKLFSFLPEEINYSNNDILNAKERGEVLGANNFEYLYFKNDNLIKYLDNFVSKLYEPSGDAAIIPTMFLSEIAHQQGYKVVLTGDGSDELFGGYLRYKLISNYYLINKFSKISKISFNNLLKKFKFSPKIRRLINTISLINSPELLYSQLLSLNNLLIGEGNHIVNTNKYLKDEIITQHYSFLEKPSQLDSFKLFDSISRADFKNLLNNQYLPKVDNSTMLFSLEARVPFLDEQLVNFILRNRKSLPLPKAFSKPAIKKLARDILPSDFSKIPKQGYGLPIRSWLSGPLYDLLHSLNLSDFEQYGIDIDAYKFKNTIDNLRDENYKVDYLEISNLWKLLMTSNWIKHFKQY